MRLRGHRRLRHSSWLFVLMMFVLMAVPVAAAQANASWTGASSSPDWSDATNWTGTPAGILSFPKLGRCVTCYTSHNDLTGASVAGLAFGNTSNQYQIGGSSLSVGTNGISDTPGGGIGNVINAPLVLSSRQTWVMGSQTAGYDSLTVLGGVSGAGQALSLSMPRGDLFVDSNIEVGPVTSNGPGGLHIGGGPKSGRPGSINATTGAALTIDGGTLTPNLGSTSGPLTMKSGTALLLGTNPSNDGTTSLKVNGPATLSPTTTTTMFINDNGSAPQTDFSQLRASGSITVAGQLVIEQGPSNSKATCVALNPGDMATLVTTSATLTGHFANAPDGTALTMASSCQSPAPQLQIHYTNKSVTATVVGSSTTTTTTTTTTPTPTPPPPATTTTTPAPTTRTVPRLATSVKTMAAGGVKTREATLAGRLTADGGRVTRRFEYGTSTHYNKATPIRTVAAGRRRRIPVRWRLTRLAPNTRYHYRLVVATRSSPGGPIRAAYGQDRRFTTRAAGRLVVRARSLRISGHTVLVPERCQSNLRCSGRFSITTTHRVRRKGTFKNVLCTTRSFRLRAHRSSVVRARLRRDCLALLRSTRHHRLGARFSSWLRTGQRGLIKRITLFRGGPKVSGARKHRMAHRASSSGCLACMVRTSSSRAWLRYRRSV